MCEYTLTTNHGTLDIGRCDTETTSDQVLNSLPAFFVARGETPEGFATTAEVAIYDRAAGHQGVTPGNGYVFAVSVTYHYSDADEELQDSTHYDEIVTESKGDASGLVAELFAKGYMLRDVTN